MSVFNSVNQEKDDKIDTNLADSLLLLIKELLSEKTTTFSKRELKAISICSKNKYINDFISNYLPNKRLERNHYEKRLLKSLEKICNAIGTRVDFSNLENPNSFFHRLSGRK